MAGEGKVSGELGVVRGGGGERGPRASQYLTGNGQVPMAHRYSARCEAINDLSAAASYERSKRISSGPYTD